MENGKKKPVKNEYLWKKLNTLAKSHNVNWQWVKGHSSNVYNNLADKLARAAAEKN